jgi:ankyrin repeat protein
MPTHSDAVRHNLEFYKKIAKSLLKSAQGGESPALERLARHTKSTEPLALHQAQLTVAREQGFASWPRFKAFIEQSQLDFQSHVASFIDAATSDFRRAEEMLAAHQQIASAGFYTALVLGDTKQVDEALGATPALAKTKSGPQNVEPLVYLCFSRYANPARSSRAGALTETARVLLRYGADPDTTFIPENPNDSRLSCLYAASGLNNNAELTQLLLGAGANPNDGESLYHSTEHADLACMILLLAHDAKPNEANALKHILDREDLDGVQILLKAGADPNHTNERAETALHWAAWRGRSGRIIDALLDAGANIEARRRDGRTAYATAALGGHTEAAKALAARGANTTLSPIDAFVSSCATASAEELDRLLAERPQFIGAPGSEGLLPDLATAHRTASVRALLTAGAPIHARGEWGATALHWSCWKGYADIVELLIDAGASLTIVDEMFHGTPPAWFAHGLQNCHERGGDYIGVARLLAVAQAEFPRTALPTGNAEVDAILRSHGVI